VFESKILGVWIPAFAGTTEDDSISNSHATLKHSFAISPRNPREVCQERPAF
jgi:hypothetical protein